MAIRFLDTKKDPFRPQEDNEKLLGLEVPYLSAIGALIYLANNTLLDIAFSNKTILQYLQGTIDLALFYSNKSNPKLIRYTDARYLSDPHKARPQTGYLFTCGDAVISWHSTKQSLAVTSSNHANIIAIHETSRECVWLRSLVHYVRDNCNLSSEKEILTILYKDNAACIA
ncbi:hypothetical protein M9H77_02000 [Catharanthus roseus]|uniref:Uncharacterized protein n=1 Tax=Catharanthus roseus TaxID=4058 RepID=A0ACC0C7M5_CATRO|nr:hypothetical protein M9H77_02000 [Catharanthus roseus]